MEIYLNRLTEIVSSDSSSQSSYEHKEMVLELLVRLYKIPGFDFILYTLSIPPIGKPEMNINKVT